VEQFIRDTIYGGKSLPRQRYTTPGKEYVYLDISGMYVYIMNNKEFLQPCGDMKWLK